MRYDPVSTVDATERKDLEPKWRTNTAIQDMSSERRMKSMANFVKSIPEQNLAIGCPGV